jgi:hypothetical protein
MLELDANIYILESRLDDQELPAVYLSCHRVKRRDVPRVTNLQYMDDGSAKNI